jgi:outer membrane lipoprotein-sorting protein
MSDEHNSDVRLDAAIDGLRGLPIAAGPDDAFRQGLIEQLANETNPRPLGRTSQSRSSTMRRLSVAAACAALLASLAAWLVLSSSTSTGSAFARMLELVGNARTVVFKSTVEIPQAWHQMDSKTMILAPDWVREQMFEGKNREETVIVQNLSEMKSLALQPGKKKATLRDMAKLPAGARPKNVIEQLRDVRESSSVLVGNEKVDGKDTRKFRCDHPTGHYLIWVAADTDLPVRVDMSDASAGTKDATKITLSDFEWNVPLDESLFTLDVPKGYELVSESPPPSMSDPKDFIATMRLIVRLNNDQFPDEYNALTVSMIPKLVDDPSLQAEERKANRRRKLAKALDRPELEKVNDEEWKAKAPNLAKQFANSAVFLQVLAQTNDWHYVGKGAKFGEAERVVAWWAPKEAPGAAKSDQPKTATVLYADFHTDTKPVVGLPTTN